MKRRVLAMFLVLVMAFSLMPTTALADSEEPWTIGDTFVSTEENAALPTVDAAYQWSGPVWDYDCGKEAHTHNTDWWRDNWCYSYKFAEGGCGGNTSRSHWQHEEECYEHDCNNQNQNHDHDRECRVTVLTCTKEEHTHNQSELRYIWTLVEAGSELQYRDWWPVYWDFDSRSDVRTSSIVTVTANNSAVQYSGGEVLSRTSLSAATADTNDVLIGGFQITVQPGYYVSRYRLVCGNHTDCGVTGYGEGITTGNTAGSYTATLTYRPDADDFDHWYNIGGMHNNASRNSGVYQPLTKPDASATNIYHTTGSNTIYPFYLLIEVEQDTSAYDVTYDWGTLADTLTATVPGPDNNLPRNTEHTVLAPGAGATEAAALGYQFQGWKVVSDTYADNIVVQAGSRVTVTGADIRLVAQWAPAVTWRYTGTVPAGATTLPATTNYAEGASVPVVQVTAPAGYKFNGWAEVTANNVDLTGSTFDMPNAPVVIEGSFSQDLTQTKEIFYTVEYYFNNSIDNIQTQKISETVWAGDDYYLAVNSNEIINEFEGYVYGGSIPAVLPAETEHGSVIKLYYHSAVVTIDVTKTVTNLTQSSTGGESIDDPLAAKVGDILQYTITVTNSGTVDAENVVIYDTLNGYGSIEFTDTENIKHSTGTYEVRSSIPVDVFTIGEIEKDGGSVTITYTYVVRAEDEGQQLTNFAFYRDGNGSDSAYVEVEDWNTLTVQHYADGVLQSGMTETYTMDEGSSWKVEVGGTANTNTYNAPETITVSGVQYAFDDPATTDAMSGTLTADTTVKLYYAKDEIGTPDPEKPDGTPDKYQVTFLYTTTSGGALANGALTKEVATVYDATAFKQGQMIPASQGVATASGSTAAETSGNYRFAGKWTLERQGHVAFDTSRTDRTLGTYQLPPAGSASVAAQQAVGGSTYIFTAVFEDIPAPAMTIEKLVDFAETDIVPVGTRVEYIIQIKNTGNVPLTDVVINDYMSYVDGNVHSVIENYRNYIQELRVTGTEDDNFVLEQDLASITINELAVDQIISVEYVYVVQEDDSGQKIHNIADAATTYEGTKYEVDDEAVITIEERKPVLSVDKELTSVNGSTTIAADYKANTGDKLVWTITVSNSGNGDAWIEAPVDTLNNGKTLTVTAVGSLETKTENSKTLYKVPAKSGNTDGYIQFTAEYMVLETDLGKKLVNTATVEGVTPDTEETPTADPLAELSEEKDLTSVKRGEIEILSAVKAGTEIITTGDVLTWTITVLNEGNANGTIKLTDTLKRSDGTTVALPLDLKGANGEYIIPAATNDQTPGEVKVTASYTVLATDAGKTLTNTVVTEKDGKEEEIESDPVSVAGYTVTYQYEGTVPNGAPAVPVEDYGTGKVAYEPDTTGIEVKGAPELTGYTFSGWTTDDATVENGKFTITKDVVFTGTWTINTPNITKIEKDLYSVNGKTGTELPDAVKPGDVLVWNIVVTNRGTADGWVELPVDTLNGATNLTVVADSSVETKVENHVTKYKVPAGGTAEFTASYTVEEDKEYPNGLVNKVIVSDKEDTDETIDVKALDVTKSLVSATSVKPGDTIEWTITVKNTGNVALTGIELTDTLTNAVGTAELYYGSTKLDLSNYTFDLAVGETKTFTAKYVTVVDDAGKQIYNTAVAEVPNDGPKDEDTPNNHVTVLKPGLNVTKTVDKASAAVGETITWTITVHNNGETDLTDITLTDTLYAEGVSIGNLELKDGNTVVTKIDSLAKGVSIELKAIYVVSAGDVGKTLINVAVAETAGNGPSDEATSPETEAVEPPYIPPVIEPNVPELNKQDHVAYIIGYEDGTVRPQNNITRAEVATIFFRLLTDASRAEYWSQSNPYSDVSIDKWYNNAISTLSNADIITGYPDGSFRPNAPITRAEFAAIAARFSEVIYNGGNSFTDVPENHWAARYIALAEYLGWVNGYPDGSFKPDQAITRAEAMTLINRVLEREVEEEHLLPDMVVWVDNLPGTWYYEAVQEATNSHTYVRLSKVVPGHSFCYEDWIEILPVPDWAALEKAWSDANDHR